MLKGKTVVIAVSGSIAAYKMPNLRRYIVFGYLKRIIPNCMWWPQVRYLNLH